MEVKKIMLTIHTKLVEAMITQAHKDHPIETCGIIAGPQGCNLPLRLIPMRNAARSAVFFKFDPNQQLQVWRDMEARDEEPIVIYHSHTDTQAYPSRTDVKFAAELRAHYVIIPTNPIYGDEIRSFRICDGMVTEERVRMLDSYKSEWELAMVA
ncbi:Proteasome lid subunit RPN8/RPN11, contains Jab1/MPN metalloenzyme (JAMM) motif [Nitrosospira sp. Nsp11]|nr:Proteasome lid subunit RPN8/RPN11, contains Jab1/MPN metalloenzyme (JAMM) motif [Nitrosospira sp. Nsp11]